MLLFRGEDNQSRDIHIWILVDPKRKATTEPSPSDGPFDEATLKGNPTGLDITATAWEFLRAFDKDEAATA